jgi:coiled-coil domain-containing protein 130
MSTLAAARADNFYYPKGWDPSKGSLNQYQGSHPLGVRAKKIKEGILVIRFEMPFHVRCTGCKRMIAKGVRFNAEKKAVGKFHSTRIWEFGFRCHLCPQRIRVQTDPENTEYKFLEGAYKILTTETATDVEFLQSQEEKIKLATDPFYRLEAEAKDIQKGKEEKTRLHDIIELQEDRSRDDYELNSQLRKKFRTEKKELEKQEKEANTYKNVALPLAELTAEDKLAAKKARFKALDPFRQNQLEKREKIRTESIFSSSKPKNQDTLIKSNRLPNTTKRLINDEINRREKPKTNSTANLSIKKKRD